MAWTYPNSLKLAMRGYTAAPESAAAAVRSALGSGWKVKLFSSLVGGAPDTPPTLSQRKVLWRSMFDAWRAIKYPSPGFVAFTGTVKYYDPLGSAGSGNSFSDPTNAWPSTANAVLIREGRTHTGMVDIPIGGTVTQIGTYDAATGARVTDLSRVATIDANGAQFCVTTQKSNFVISGLAFKYTTVPNAIIRAFYASYGGGANSCIVEHYWVRDMLPGSSYVDTSEAIYIRGKDAIVRHGHIDNCRSGGIYIGDNGGTGTGPENCKIYDNIIELNSGIAVSGPDPIQIASPGGTYGDCEVMDNWAVMPINAKQVLVATSVGALTSPGTDSLLVHGNIFLGPDHTLTQIGGDPTKTILSEVANTSVEGNILECASWGIGLYGNGSHASGNLLTFDYSGKTGQLGILLQADDVLVRNNTLVVMPGTTLTEAFEHTGSGFTGCDISDNIVWNFGGTITYGVRRRVANCTETGNIVYGATNPWVDNGLSTISAGSGSVTSDPLLDGNFKPKTGSPALTGGGSPPTFLDPDGVTSDSSPFRGAYQSQSVGGNAQVASGTASGSLGGSNGAITGTVSVVFTGACNPGQANPFYGLLEKADGSTYLRGSVGLEGDGAEFTISRPVDSGETVPVVVAIGVSGGGTPTATHVVGINCGGAAYTASNGVEYLADNHFTGGDVGSLNVDVIDTPDDTLYRTERFLPHEYDIPVVSNKTYEVSIQLSEIWNGIAAPGDRVFDIKIQGGTAQEVLIEDVDIFAAVGALRTYTITRSVLVVTSPLTIEFIAGVQNPKVSAILVRSTDGGAYVAPTTPPPSGTNMDNIIAMQKANASGVVLANAPGNNWALGGVVTKGGDLRSIAQPTFWSGNPRSDLDAYWRWLMPWYVVWDLVGHAAGLNARAEFRKLQGWAYHDDNNVWEKLLDVLVPIGGAYSRNLVNAGTNPPSSGTDGSVRWVRINPTDSVFHGYPGVTLPSIRAERVVTIATRIEARKAPYGAGTDQSGTAKYGLQVGCDTYPSSDASLSTIQASYNPGSGQSRFEELTTSWKWIYWHPLNTSRAVDGSYPWSAKHTITEAWLRANPIPE